MSTIDSWMAAHDKGVCGVGCPVCETAPRTDTVTIPATELARLRAVEGAARVVIKSHRCAEISHRQAPELFALDAALGTCSDPFHPEHPDDRGAVCGVCDRLRFAPDPRDARIAALENALRPFAAYAETFTTMAPDDQRVAEWGTPRTPVLITVGDLRCARTTLRGDK